MVRTPALLGSAVLAVTALTVSPAAADTAPKIARGSCSVEANSGTAVCIVQLDANPNGEWGTTTWSGYGGMTLDCEVSGAHFADEGGVGFYWQPWPHGIDVCRLTVFAWDGFTDAYVV